MIHTALIRRASALRSRAPQEWQDFLLELGKLAVNSRDDVLRAPLDTLPGAQARAVALTTLAADLEKVDKQPPAR